MLDGIVYIILALATIFMIGAIETDNSPKRSIYAILSILFSVVTAVGIHRIDVPGDTFYSYTGLVIIFLIGYSIINAILLIIAYSQFTEVSTIDQVLHR